jgi:hypothetical protein
MATFNLRYYTTWAVWFQAKAFQLAKRGQLDELQPFLLAGGSIIQALFAPWELLVPIFSGVRLSLKTLSNVGKALLAFGVTNPDPLKGVREGIEAMYTRWGKPAPVAATPTPTGGSSNGQ